MTGLNSIIGLLILFGGLFILLWSVSHFRQWYIIRSLSETSASSIDTDSGLVKLSGTVDAIGDKVLISPGAGNHCVAYQLSVQERRDGDWVTVDDELACVPFHLTDSDTSFYVNPNEAVLTLEESKIRDVQQTSSGVSVGDVGLNAGASRVRIFEKTLEVGEDCTVIGEITESADELQITQWGSALPIFVVSDLESDGETTKLLKYAVVSGVIGVAWTGLALGFIF